MNIKKVSFGNGQFNQFMMTPVNNSMPQAQTNVSQQNQTTTPKSKDSSKTIAYAASAVAIASIGLSTALAIKSGAKNKNLQKGAQDVYDNLSTKLDDVMNSVKEDIAKLRKQTDAESELNDKIGKQTQQIQNVDKEVQEKASWHDNWLKELEKQLKEKGDFSVGWLKALEERINGVSARVGELSGVERNIVKVDNLPLLQNITSGGTRIMLPKAVAEEIQGAASRLIHKGTPIPKLDKTATTWSISAESIPEKEGGLGEVPVQIAKNMTKELGINNYLVRPLNEIPGVSSIIEKDGKWHYKYKDLHMEVDRVAEFEIYAFRNGRTEKETIEVFYGTDPMGFKRLMFRNKDYFGANGLYKDSQRASEKERYAFLPKAVYEFAKMKLDPNSQTSYRIFNEKLYNEIQAPDTLLLNDWHAAAMAGLTKLLAPVESSMGELSKVAADKLKKMNVLELIHNLDYQGDDWWHAGDILNTLYGKYAYDIYTNAKTGFGIPQLENVHVIDGGVNLANIGAALANKLKPVSPTYARELATDPVRSRALQHVMQLRLEEGTMEGHSNGWDKVVNELSPSNIINDINNNLNNDKFSILKSGIDSLELTPAQRKSVKEIFTDPKNNNKELKFKYNNTEELLKALRELGIPELTKFLDKMDAEGVTTLRTLKPLTSADDIDTIMENRRYNKEQFIRYLQSMNEYNRTHKNFFNLAEEGITDLSHVNMDDLDNQVVLNLGTRFVGQKGVDIALETIRQINREWAQKYPGKPKPVWVLGGADGEGGKWEQMARQFKADMGKDAETVPYMVGYAPNNVFHSGSDFTLYPGYFEPDGSKWESLYKGTPAIGTRVGGQVDSIIDGYNGFLSRRTVPEAGQSGYDFFGTMVYDFKEAVYRAIDTFFDKPKFKDMVRHSIDGNQSWLIKDKDGKIVGGALLGHLEDLGYNLDDFPMIANAEVRKAFTESHKISVPTTPKPEETTAKEVKLKKSTTASVRKKTPAAKTGTTRKARTKQKDNK